MANLTETGRWEAGIYQWETSDPVQGGPNGIDNRPTRELANRTLWLKNELAKAVASIGTNKTEAAQAYALKTTQFTAGAGLTGGGTLGGNRTLSLGTPSDLSETSESVAVSNTHSHKLPRASTTARGIVKTNNTLTGTATDEALSAAMGKKLDEEKLGNTGAQKITKGRLEIASDVWEKLRFTNANGSYWKFETEPVSTSVNGMRFNYLFIDAAGREAARLQFPRLSGTENVAYQSWVEANAARLATGKMNVATTNYYADQSAGYNKSGFYRANGFKLNDIALPSMEIHIAHPEQTNGAHARGIGFSYGSSAAPYGLFTTAWDGQGNYLGMKTVLTELNGVMLTGNQTIDGGKAFRLPALFMAGLKVGRGVDKNAAVLAQGSDDTYLHNPTSNKFLQLKDNGTLSYSGDKIMLHSARSDAVNLDSSDRIATAKAVKTAYDNSIRRGGAVGLGGAGHQIAIGWDTAGLVAKVDNTVQNVGVPSGAIAYFAGETVPFGWLKANGAAVSRTAYAALFAAIGTRYGAGNGSTTFNLPDLRGEFIRGWDDGRKVDTGRTLGSGQADNLPSHRHATGFRFGTSGNEFALIRNNWESSSNVAADVASADVAKNYGHNENYNLIGGMNYQGSNDRYATTREIYDRQGEVRPRNIALMPCIKV